MKIEAIMSNLLTMVTMDTTLKEIKEIFERRKFHHVLVVEAEKLVGIISDRDLLKVLSPSLDTITETSKDRAVLNKKAHQIMTRNLVTVKSSDSVMDAIRMFENHKNISCLPIIDELNQPKGIVSWRDIFHAAITKSTALKS